VEIEVFKRAYEPEWRKLEAFMAHGPEGSKTLADSVVTEVSELHRRLRLQLVVARADYRRDPLLVPYLQGLESRVSRALRALSPPSPRPPGPRLAARYGAAIRRTGPFILVAAGLLLACIVGAYIWAMGTPFEARMRVLPPQAREAVLLAARGGAVQVHHHSPWVVGYLFGTNVKAAISALILAPLGGLGPFLAPAGQGLREGRWDAAFFSAGQGALCLSLSAPHAFLELTADCVAWGAGLRIAWNLLRPRYRPLGGGFGPEVAECLLVAASIAPPLAVAAVMEGLVSTLILPAAWALGAGLALELAYVVGLIVIARRAVVKAGRKLEHWPLEKSSTRGRC